MAARLDAVTRSSPFSSFISNSSVKTYTRKALLHLRDYCLGRAPSDSGSIPLEIIRSAARTKINNRPIERRCRRRCERKQKRGKRAGIQARLQLAPHKSAVPSIFLANTRSLVNKMDDVRLRVTNNRLDSCITVFTETWLHENIPDLAAELAGHSLYRADRTANSSKVRGGGVCVYIHNSWCIDTVGIERHCCPDLEFLTLKRVSILL